MKLPILAGTALAAVIMLPAAASAAPQTSRTTTVTTNDRGTVTRTTVTRERGRRGWHWRTRCKTWWHHGRKYRSCKRVRVHW
ncbi:MAG: hypothetical protein JSR79_10170 [Proteobacteria bacterium]|nr:hypothetical protein [Pseudomonadota bacterium]